MVSFVCDNCQDVVKKPKLDQHSRSCGTPSYTCVDCNNSFGRSQWKDHTTCISEAEKYQKGLFRGKKTGQQQQHNHNHKNPASANANAPAPAAAAAVTPVVEKKEEKEKEEKKEKKDKKDRKKEKRKREEEEAENNVEDSEQAAPAAKVAKSDEAKTPSAKSFEPLNELLYLNMDSLKWRKVISKALKEQKERKIDEVRAEVIEQLLPTIKEKLAAVFDDKVKSSSKFRIHNDRIAMKKD